jgi:twitching motility protein PilT
MPAPVPETEAPADQGWNYSFVADQASAPPVEATGADLPPAEAPFGQPPAGFTAAEPFTEPFTEPFAEAPVASLGEPLGEPGPSTFAPSPFVDPGVPAYDTLETPAAPVAFDAPVVAPMVTEAPVADVAPAYDLAPPAPEAPAAPPVLPPPFVPERPAPVDAGAPVEPAVLVAESEADEEAYARGTTEAGVDEADISLNDLLIHILDTGASDLHLTSGARPSVRLNGELKQMEEQPILTPPVIQRVMYAALTQKQREKFEEELELDFAYSVPGRARFRVNLYRQRDALGAAFRIIPFEIKKLEDLGVPPSVANFASLPRGFVLVTGPTGSGKSTTLAALVDLANRTRAEHIMTVEDPIEFLHRHQKCIVNQREVGEDTWSFQNALKHVLRQDPDIILVGEMRDLETISVALTAAETGHLVFATLHTQDAAQTIDRIIDVFPTNQQQQVRVQLAGALQGVVCQTLAKTRDGQGRAVATEVLVATPAIRNLIREGKTHQIYSAMQAGAKHGMHTMDQHLADLVMKGRITYETGLEKCHHIEDFNRLSGRG